jgi:hypothetical protein
MKSFLRNTVASSALLSMMTGSVIAQDNSDQEQVEPPRFILPYSGDINPFYGDINPFYGDINPFYGDISPFWGDISPFWGDINPFYGDINPFYGDISPFWGDINPFRGDINPFYGDINPFWGDIGPFWGDLSAYWGDISPFGDGTAAMYADLVGQIDGMFDDAQRVFGSAIEDETGRSYDEFKAELLARYGIDLSDPASLEHVTDEQRAAFFLGFYDGLMSYSGMDHVDHWMPTINWSPALSQAANAGNGTIVGLLDFSFSNEEGLQVRTSAGDREDYHFNHGAAVAGLIAAPYDGTGVMGVAPNSILHTYNPFDETLGTNWTDVLAGLVSLSKHNPSVINASLGMPGWTFHQDWANILSDRQLRRATGDIVFVFAAGNDGSTQTVDVDWSSVSGSSGASAVANLLVVGSVSPMGEISSFSNRPGTACFVVDGVCQDGFRLMDRFLVAPGELILVSDGEGGVVRQSGTSFAAPLVTGAAALVQGRWSWLTPRDVTDVLLLSARDLGAPGTDEVYGRGLLDVGAAMSPLDADNLFVIDMDRKRQVRGLGLIFGQLTFHRRGENTLTLFEELNDTVRDFVVSLDDLEMDPDFSVEEAQAAAEAYLYEQTASFAGTSFNNTVEYSQVLSQHGNLQISAVAAPADPRDQISAGEFPFQASFSIVDTVTDRELRFGSGEGALALNNQDGFGMFSDHRPETGGVNPVLGFASGGAYAMTGLRLGEATRMSLAVTSVRDEETFVMPHSGEETALYDGLDAYVATAFLADISHDLSDSVTVHASYTYLHEDTGLLGAHGGGSLSFDGGSQTSAVTFGAEAILPLNLTLSSSATVAQTQAASFDSGMLSMPENALSTAFQLTARRDGVFTSRDAVRLSVIQPLYVEDGALEYTAASVGDRETGELTFDTQTWELGGQRPLIAEALYATPLFGDHADLSVFTRVELSDGSFDQQASGLTSGARFKIDF